MILKKLCFFLSATFAFRISMLHEIEKIRDFHFVKKCKLSNEGCQILLFFTVKIHPPHPGPLPPLGGEGIIFMSGGDQIPVMMVCDSNSGVRH
jgi:hypothetical protein